jgi:hypothetical protein
MSLSEQASELEKKATKVFALFALIRHRADHPQNT